MKELIYNVLGLKDGEYCVVGGAVEVLGIRPSNDLDILVSKEAFERIAKSFNLDIQKSFLGSEQLIYSGVEIFRDDGFGRTAEEWINNSQKVKGIVIGSTQDLLRWKEKLMAKPGRKPEKIPVDLQDIKVLGAILDEEFYLEQHRIGEENEWY
jgi:hypothetical protein